MSEHLEKFLNLVAKHQSPIKERTIFSLGGRGYYENATSDMLAFFLRPVGEHGFGTLFLSALFEVMGESCPPVLTGASVDREVRTKNGNRIDLQIVGGDWCFVVENKIFHVLNNPLSDYEDHAKNLAAKTFFAVLSPTGEGYNPNWKGVKYLNYCTALRKRFSNVLFNAPHSKWHLFAQEFILHLENELYNPPMTDDQILLIEKHYTEIAEIKKLEADYKAYLDQQIRHALSGIVPNDSLIMKDQGWAIRYYCPSKWGKSNLALSRDGRTFKITAYLVELTDGQHKSADNFFKGMEYWPEGDWLVWRPLSDFETREQAIAGLARFSQFLTGLHRTSPEPVQPPQM